MERILQDLYDNEINFSISCFWDGGFDVRLGDEMNGWKANASFDTIEEAILFLEESARENYPKAFQPANKRRKTK